MIWKKVWPSLCCRNRTESADGKRPCLDLEAKKSAGGVAVWGYEDVKTKLWPLSPLRRMWGIGSRLEKTLNRMGIFTVGQLAHYDLSRLEKTFGVMGNQLYYHAWGIEFFQRLERRSWRGRSAMQKARFCFAIIRIRRKSSMSFLKCVRKWRKGARPPPGGPDRQSRHRIQPR